MYPRYAPKQALGREGGRALACASEYVIQIQFGGVTRYHASESPYFVELNTYYAIASVDFRDVAFSPSLVG